MKKIRNIFMLLSIISSILAGCGPSENSMQESHVPENPRPDEEHNAIEVENDRSHSEKEMVSPPSDEQSAETNHQENETVEHEKQETENSEHSPEAKNSVQVVTSPDNIAVLVNQQYKLPADYVPQDLVYPDVPFIFEEKTEKRQMRKEAADALQELFSAAQADGISLYGVSAYRSYERQQELFEYYVERDGLETAKTYSAMPGHSEHQTGLAIDVTGGNQSCVVEDCFAETPEAKWLADHAAEYGFIIRYLEGREGITGYKYEPWHLRYVGKEIAQEIASLGITLEEYLDEIPVIHQQK